MSTVAPKSNTNKQKMLDLLDQWFAEYKIVFPNYLSTLIINYVLIAVIFTSCTDFIKISPDKKTATFSVNMCGDTEETDDEDQDEEKNDEDQDSTDEMMILGTGGIIDPFRFANFEYAYTNAFINFEDESVHKYKLIIEVGDTCFTEWQSRFVNKPEFFIGICTYNQDYDCKQEVSSYLSARDKHLQIGINKLHIFYTETQTQK